MTNEEKQAAEQKIWKLAESKLHYWIREHLWALEAKSISIHELERGGGLFSFLLFDQDDKSCVVINIDTTYLSFPERAVDECMLEPKIVEKIANLYNENSKVQP